MHGRVGAAHDAGIKVFLDVTTHGVVTGSPLIKQHPSWFLGGKWAMTDFKYEDPEFVEWWVRATVLRFSERSCRLADEKSMHINR